MISDHPGLFFTLLSVDFYETLDRYAPGEEYRQPVVAGLGEGWDVVPRGFWTQCTPAGVRTGIQGWKIHLSATTETAVEMLVRAVPILRHAHTPFKFVSDRRMLQLGLSKNWPRSGAGKFVTVYPATAEVFADLAEAFYQATGGWRGPYILSDRPYRDSRVVFYRYGEHTGVRAVAPTGERIPAIVDPDGRMVRDDRKAFFQLPGWIVDPFASTGVSADSVMGGAITLHERYQVLSAERFSSVGGLYHATDLQTGEGVFIREARPFLGNGPNGVDSLQVLAKEGRILRRLERTGYVPRFIDEFAEWEHHYVVQERLDAESLWGYAINFTLGMGASQARDLFSSIRETCEKLAVGLEAVHREGIVLRDLTKSNVMFTRDGARVKFVDMELAYEVDGQMPHVAGWTQGYASAEQLRGERPTFADDYYAFGALMLDMVAFTATGLASHRAQVLRGLAMTLRDAGLPTSIRRAIEGLTDPDPRRRLTPAFAVDMLSRGRVRPAAAASWQAGPRDVGEVAAPSPSLERQLAFLPEAIGAYIDSVSDFTRGDRVVPASSEVFQTNGVCVQYGAAGIAAFLARTRGVPPARMIEWICRHATGERVPSGLYVGLGGVAVALLACGCVPEAEAVFARVAANGDSTFVPGLYYGQAGVGLACIHLYRATLAQPYLDRAAEVAAELVAMSKEDADGVYWETNGLAQLGLGHGSSGVALFFQYLNCLLPGRGYQEVALRALDFDIANREETAGRLLWYPYKGAKASAPKSPHMRYGTAGVGSVAIRVYAATGAEPYLAFAKECAAGVASRYTNKLWQDYGLAGYGEFLLDMYQIATDVRYRNQAFHVAEGLLPFAIRRDAGVAFAGTEMVRLSCDYGQGSAGIGDFIGRLLDPSRGRFLFPDEVLRPRRSVPLERAPLAVAASGS